MVGRGRATLPGQAFPPEPRVRNECSILHVYLLISNPSDVLSKKHEHACIASARSRSHESASARTGERMGRTPHRHPRTHTRNSARTGTRPGTHMPTHMHLAFARAPAQAPACVREASQDSFTARPLPIQLQGACEQSSSHLRSPKDIIN